jgi:hypothetical protein
MVRRAREGTPTTACGMRVGVFESWNGFISEISPALVRVADVFRQLPVALLVGLWIRTTDGRRDRASEQRKARHAVRISGAVQIHARRC